MFSDRLGFYNENGDNETDKDEDLLKEKLLSKDIIISWTDKYVITTRRLFEGKI